LSESGGSESKIFNLAHT